MPAHQRPKRLVGRQSLPPQRGRGEAERMRGVGSAFELQDEQQPVDQHQPLGPQFRRGSTMTGIAIEDGLQEPLDRAARLSPQFLCDAGLTEAGCLQHRR